ncbi:GNAT family N-acetyltransferase [Bacillus xiapuensis]|uniref:GNAT family N-acetyltransferase n=1 Tax=Bacillus xiapuensis TaxID=2014075 RepID=A0ABU6N738_9BACI|nr:GNAT family N-acetyltransferase [Bacillus xiapuensis]
MDFKIVSSKYEEANELFRIQKEAFHSEIIKYKDYHSSPATESWNNFVFRMLTTSHFSIYVNDKLAGGICIVKQADNHNYLYRIFLGSEYQNDGLGSKILRQLEYRYPEVKKWSLDTPKDNQRNRHFYEKLGYKKTGEQIINKYLTLIDYEKIL